MSIATNTESSSGEETQSRIEQTANECVPTDAEGLSITDEPMLCPPVCVAAAAGGGFAAGAAVGCYVEWCVDGRPQLPESAQTVELNTNDSVDELVRAVEE